MNGKANPVSATPRRVITLAYHWPPTVKELEAIYYLSQMLVRVVPYAGGEPQALGHAKALGDATDARKVGDRIVVTCEWRGMDPVPDSIGDVIGFREEQRKTPVTRYPGIGGRP